MLCSVPDSDLLSCLSPAGDALWWNAGWVPAAKSWAGWEQTVERICRTQLHVITFTSWGQRTSPSDFYLFLFPPAERDHRHREGHPELSDLCLSVSSRQVPRLGASVVPRKAEQPGVCISCFVQCLANLLPLSLRVLVFLCVTKWAVHTVLYFYLSVN